MCFKAIYNSKKKARILDIVVENEVAPGTYTGIPTE